MAHFAELDKNNTVVRVIVVSNADILDKDGIERESLGINVCKQVCGENTRWVQTSYNGTFRKQYAAIGSKYDLDADVFYSPTGPFPSWALDANFDWQPPTPRPDDGKSYNWDEDNLVWVEIELTEGGE